MGQFDYQDRITMIIIIVLSEGGEEEDEIHHGEVEVVQDMQGDTSLKTQHNMLL